MKTIFKYQLPIAEHGVIERIDSVPRGFEFLPNSAKPDPHGMPCAWAMVNDEAERDQVLEFLVVWSGAPIPEGDWKYLGTMSDNMFVYHWFWRYEP